MRLISNGISGILPVNKPIGKTSFALVAILRKATGIRKIGHAGTLDPFATGVMVMLIGKDFTRLSSQFLNEDKEYRATLHLGITTDTYDCDGVTVATSPVIPTRADIEEVLLGFQGTILQTPPMFSAKKVGGKKLYELARKGITIEREAVPVTIHSEIINYAYPYIEIHVKCTKGTYIRTLAHEIGIALNCGAHLSGLMRTRSGAYSLEHCCDGSQILDPYYPWQDYLLA
jgi:tRNA pseudouridine55 synthase